jgi:multidrug efflux pump subunit AcrB
MIGGRGENQTTLIVDLKRWDERPDREQHVSKMIPKIQMALQSVPEPKWQVFAPPAIPGLGNANGISVHIQDKTGTDPIKLDEVKKVLLAKLNANPNILAAFAGYNAETPKLRFNLDRTKAEMFHVPVATVYATLQNYLGSRYVNDVNLGTQVNRVTVAAEAKGRAKPEDVERLYVRSDTGAMVPIGSLGTISRELGPRIIYTRDKYVTAGLNILPAPGVASGTA